MADFLSQFEKEVVRSYSSLISRCLEKNEGFNCTYQKRKTHKLHKPHKPHKPHKTHKRRLSTSMANIGSSSDMIPDTCSAGIPLAVQNEESHAGLVSLCYSRFEGSHNPERVMEAHVRPVMPVDISPEDWLHVAEAMLDPNIR